MYRPRASRAREGLATNSPPAVLDDEIFRIVNFGWFWMADAEIMAIPTKSSTSMRRIGIALLDVFKIWCDNDCLEHNEWKFVLQDLFYKGLS
jgi:hypothetical protein